MQCMQELSDNMLTALRDGLKACLLANHGMICFGSSLPSAFKLVRGRSAAVSVSTPQNYVGMYAMYVCMYVWMYVRIYVRP